jgi:hypothetical protein
MEDAPRPADSAPDAAGPDPDARLDVSSKDEEWGLLRFFTGLLPGLFRVLGRFRHRNMMNRRWTPIHADDIDTRTQG